MGMRDLSSYISRIYQNTKLPSSFERRKTLISEMQKLEDKTVHCFTCPGTCCTKSSNSMLITPIEALEILSSIKIENYSDEEIKNFKTRMNQTIQEFRLNVEIYTGKKNSQAFRKTYTCPFFNNGALGCALSRASKPYGCLGFNPKTSEDNGKSCASNTNLLTIREEDFLTFEDEANEIIKKEFALSWNKQNIPQALLDILKKL